MKRLFVIVSLCMIFVYSCDPTSCYSYTIENKTDKNLELVKFSSDSLDVNSSVTEILANNSYIEADDYIFGLGGIVYQYDSIQVRVNKILVKTYYPNDEGKSIFKTSTYDYGEAGLNSWKLLKLGEIIKNTSLK